MKIDTTEIDKAILQDKKLTKAEMDFAFAKMDIEDKYAKIITDEVEAIVKYHSKICANEILELYEKMKEGKECQ